MKGFQLAESPRFIGVAHSLIAKPQLFCEFPKLLGQW
jgi:hypothetical protein